MKAVFVEIRRALKDPPLALATLSPCNRQGLAVLPSKSGYLQNSRRLQKVMTRLSKKVSTSASTSVFSRFNKPGAHQYSLDTITRLV